MKDNKLYCHTITHLNCDLSKELTAQSPKADFNLEIFNNEREFICKLFDLRLYSFRNLKKTV